MRLNQKALSIGLDWIQLQELKSFMSETFPAVSVLISFIARKETRLNWTEARVKV